MSAEPRAVLPPPGDPQTLYVIDISGYVFRAYHAIPPLSNSKGEPTHAVAGVTAMLDRLVRERKPAYLAVAMDSKGPSFRKAMYEPYKANRPPPPPDLSQQMERVREIVEAYSIPTHSIAGLEADDLIATLCARARAKKLRVVIVSADKDLLQLVGDGVLMYDSMRERVYGPAETREKLGVGPALVRDYLALTGDSSDNVPGVPSVGAKTAVALLEAHGSLDGIYRAVDTIAKKGLKEKLIAHRDDARISRDLVTLKHDVELPFDLEHLRYGGADVPRLRRLFRELEFTRLLSRLPEAAEPSPAPIVAGDALAEQEPAADTSRLCLDAAALGRLVKRLGTCKDIACLPVLDGPDPFRDPLVGVAVCAGEDIAAYIPVGHRYIGCPTTLNAEQAVRGLSAVMSNGNVRRHTDDLKRDCVVFGRLGVVPVAPCADTMLASYLVDTERRDHSIESLTQSELGRELTRVARPGKQGRAAAEPASMREVAVVGRASLERAGAVLEVSAKLAERVGHDGLRSLLEDVELPLARVLAEMEAGGVGLDVARLSSLARELDGMTAKLETECQTLAGHPFNVASPRQLETILFDEVGLPVIKKTKTARSTDHAVLEELALSHELPAKILEHRSYAKLKGTYVDALPRQVDRSTGRVHTRFNQAVTATGRLSSSDPNLQNIPIRSELGRSIREAFVARKGWQILSADYSQIELRVLAHLSGDAELLDAFRTNVDVHTRTARGLFDVPDAKVTREMRGRAKTVNYAVIYGQTSFALGRNLRVDRAEAQRYIDAFFRQFSGVKTYLDGVVAEAHRVGYVTTLLGRRRRLPDLGSRNHNLRTAAERMARNTPIQGSAADIMKVAMLRVHRAMKEGKLQSQMVLTVHDELVFEVPSTETEAMQQLARHAMEHAAELKVPLTVDLGLGCSWGKAH